MYGKWVYFCCWSLKSLIHKVAADNFGRRRFFWLCNEKTQRLFRVYRNFYYPVIWGLCMVILSHCKDPYWTTRIQWKVGPGFFVAQMTLFERVWLLISFAPSFYLDEDVLSSHSRTIYQWTCFALNLVSSETWQTSKPTNKQNKTNKQTDRQTNKQ